MGIIRKQSVYSSLFIYTGFIIGAINVLLLFPNERFFKPEEFGLTRLLLDVATVASIFCTLGISPAIVKFYPFYNAYVKKEELDLPFISLLVMVVGVGILLLTGTLLENAIIRKFSGRSPLFVDYFYLVYPMAIGMAVLSVLESFAWSFRRTVLPVFVREVLVRFITTVLVLLVFTRVLDFRQFINLYSLLYLPGAVILLVVLARKERLTLRFRLSHVTRRIGKQVATFSLFIFSGQVLNILARTIDAIIIASVSSGGLIDTAVFTVATYLVTLMEVPLRSVTGIGGAIIAQAWKDRDMARLHSIYKKTALNLSLLGAGIFGILLLNINNAVIYLGPTYTPLVEIVLILGFSKMIDLGTGLNSNILLSSKYWKLDFITNAFLVLLSSLLNYVLVKKMGLIGSAYANLISFAIYNLVRFVAIWKLFHMQPFTFNNLRMLIIAGSCFFAAWLIPTMPGIVLDSLLRTFVFAVLYATLIVRLRISEDINALVGLMIGRATAFFSLIKKGKRK